MSVRSRVYRERRLPAGRPLAAIIAGLWRNGEQGVWYDPSDLSTMFQDAAGTLPVYARQLFPETVKGAAPVDALKAGTQVFKNDEVRVWTLDGQVLIASIKTKMHAIGGGVIEGLLQAQELAEKVQQG